MESILKSDIFFLITSISVVIMTLVMLTAGYYFIRMLRNFYKISSILRNYTENTETELKDMIHQIRHSPLFTFFFGKDKKENDYEKSKKKSI